MTYHLFLDSAQKPARVITRISLQVFDRCIKAYSNKKEQALCLGQAGWLGLLRRHWKQVWRGVRVERLASGDTPNDTPKTEVLNVSDPRYPPRDYNQCRIISSDPILPKTLRDLSRSDTEYTLGRSIGAGVGKVSTIDLPWNVMERVSNT